MRLELNRRQTSDRSRPRAVVPLRFLSIIALSLATPLVIAAAVATEGQEAGNKVFVESKCGRCHGVASEGIEPTASEKMRGPVLDQLPVKREAEWLTRYLKRQEKFEGKVHRSVWKGTEKELEALVDWLRSLRDA